MRLSAPAMIVTLAASTGLPPLDTAAADTGWGGPWLTCEFARPQTPPRCSHSAAWPRPPTAPTPRPAGQGAAEGG